MYGWLSRLCLFSLLMAAPAAAQFETSDVLGTVRDASSSAVAKASVTLLNQETGASSKATTDEGGNYTFPNVKVGKYTVSVEATGFSKSVATDVQVDVNARQRVDFTMQVGQITDSVQVTAAAATLETDSSEKGQVINRQQIVELPLERTQLLGSSSAFDQRAPVAHVGAVFS